MKYTFILFIFLTCSWSAWALDSNTTSFGVTVWANGLSNRGTQYYDYTPSDRPIDMYSKDYPADVFFNGLPYQLGGGQYLPCRPENRRIISTNRYCDNKFREYDAGEEWRNKEMPGMEAVQGASAGEYLPEESSEGESGPVQLTDSGIQDEQA